MAKKERKKGNNVAVKAAIGTLMILVLSMIIFFIGDLMFSFRNFGSREEFGQIMMNSMIITSIISFVMLVLSIYLIYIYLKDYLELKSKFTLGVLLAVVAFMLFAITSNPVFHIFFGLYGREGIFKLIPLLFATISLAILAWISSR
jgi:magnesium-transporting ATPase (P-type)